MSSWNLVPLLSALLALTGPSSAQEVSVAVQGRIGPAAYRVQLGRPGCAVRAPAPSYASSRSVHARGSYARTRVRVPGHYATLERRVWVPKRTERRWIEPVVRTERDVCGNAYEVVLRPGRWTWVTVPGHYAYEPTRSWVPGCWKLRY